MFQGTSAEAAAGFRGGWGREMCTVGLCCYKMSECRLTAWLLPDREDSLLAKCHEISSADVTG